MRQDQNGVCEERRQDLSTYRLDVSRMIGRLEGQIEDLQQGWDPKETSPEVARLQHEVKMTQVNRDSMVAEIKKQHAEVNSRMADNIDTLERRVDQLTTQKLRQTKENYDLKQEVGDLKVKLLKDPNPTMSVKVFDLTGDKPFDWKSANALYADQDKLPTEEEVTFWRTPKGAHGEKYEVSSQGSVRGNNQMNQGNNLKTYYAPRKGDVQVNLVASRSKEQRRKAQQNLTAVADLMILAGFNGSRKHMNWVAAITHFGSYDKMPASLKTQPIPGKVEDPPLVEPNKKPKKERKTPDTTKRVTDRAWAYPYRIARLSNTAWRDPAKSIVSGRSMLIRKVVVKTQGKSGKDLGIQVVLKAGGTKFVKMADLRRKAGYVPWVLSTRKARKVTKKKK